MSLAVSLGDIDGAISHLNYRNGGSSKAKLLQAVRSHYTDESSVADLQEIPPEPLIVAIWGPCDPTLMRSRRKNLSSIRSSVNADLLRVFRDGGNPGGIVLSPANVFVMSDEAKDQALEQFQNSVRKGEAMSLGRITEALGLINGLLAEPGKLLEADAPDGIAKLKALVAQLSQKTGSGGSQPGPLQASGAPSSSALPTKEATSGPAGGTGAEPGEGKGTAGKDGARGEGGEAGVEDLPGVGPDRIVEEDVEVIEEEGPLDEDVELVEEEEVHGETEPAEDQDRESEAVEDPLLEEVLEEIGSAAEEDLPDGTACLGDRGNGGGEPGETGSEISGAAEPMEEDETLEELEVIEDTDPERDCEDPDSASVQESVRAGREGEAAGDIRGEGGEGAGGGAFRELGLPFSHLEPGGDCENYRTEAERRDAKLLAEAFDGYLGAMDRYYNQYILIPAGEYPIGPRTPAAHDLPLRRVRLAPFYIGMFPVTNALFEIFVEKTGYRTTAERRGHAMVYEGRSKKTRDPVTGLERLSWKSALTCRRVEGACWYQPCGPGSTLFRKRNHPVVQVSIEDALAFAAWTGKRLPSEEEWEAAARSVEGYAFPWGETWKDGASNVEANSAGDTTPVDAFDLSSNALGIMDTLGNVLEWTVTRATGPPAAAHSKIQYLAKGGSWVSESGLPLWSRFPVEMDASSNILGFRCVAQ